MPDYNLGRAHGDIQIDYDGSGADRAARDLDKVAASSAAADKSLTKTEKTLSDTDRQMDSSASSARGYSARLRDVESASRDVDNAERQLKSTLLDSKASLDDVKDAEDRLGEARKRHVSATNAARDAHKALSSEMGIGSRVARAFSDILPNLHSGLEKLTTVGEDAGAATGGLASKIGGLTKIVALFGPEGKAAAAGLSLFASGMDKAGASASAAGGFAQNIAQFEVAFGKISGLTLAVPSLAGLASIGGAAGVQGVVEMADAAKQLSGVLGLLPSVVSAVGFSMETLKVAFHGVGDALTDMMSADPKKFLEDIKDMGPVAAQAMLQIAGFRNQFMLAGAGIQDSFFTQIIQDIKPLIQTWLPAVTSGMTQIAGGFGDLAHDFAGLLMQPAAMHEFQSFIANVSAGIQALRPALAPLMNIFNELAVVGSSFFQQIGGQITHVLNFFAQVIDNAASSGKLQAWIQDGINAFGHLVNIVYSVGSAFLNIMDIAEKFGGGGLLGWLEQLAQQLNVWTQSADGQKTLISFFTVLREATDAFTPMLKPLVEGLAAIGTAFTQLGIATAPGWQVLFDAFAKSMEQLGPQIVSIAPALTNFLGNLGVVFSQLMASIGPQLPEIFKDLSDAFVALLPQLGPLVDAFVQLVEQVAPMLPSLFTSVTQALETFVRYVPIAIGFVRNFVSVVNGIVEAVTGALRGIEKFVERAADWLQQAWDKISGFFGNLGSDGEKWGKGLIDGLVRGIKSGVGWVGDAARSVVDEISSWFPHSPAKQGPFSGAGYTMVRGQKMVTDMAAGMRSAQSEIESAASSTASAASAALSGGAAGAGSAGGAPSPGGAGTVGNALLPDNIAGADTSILTAYLRHQFSDTNGLKGLAKDLGNMLKVAQDGFNLINQHAVQPMFQALGMLPGANDQTWRKLTPKELAAQQQSDLLKDSLDANKGPSWQDVLGPVAGAPVGGSGQVPLGVSASSSKADIQKAIIAAGRARGMNDAAIQTALAVAADESGFNPTISGGVQGSAGLVSGLYQQSPSSGWGTLAQVNDPNYAINKFYDAYAKQLAKNPNNPMLAAVLTQNPQLGSSAQGSDYWNAVSNKLGEANSIMGAYGKGVTGPTWGMVTNTAPPPATPSVAGPTPITGAQMQTSGGQTLFNGKPVSQVDGQWYYISDLAKGTLPGSGWGPPGSVGQGPKQAAPPAAPSSTGTAGLPDAHGAHTQIAQVEVIAKRFGLQLTAGRNDHRADGGYHPLGEAGDFSNGQGNTAQQLAFAKYMADNFGPLLAELIYSDPNFSQLIKNGKAAPGTSVYDAGTLAGHTNHVHVAITDQMAAAFQQASGAPAGLPGSPTSQSAQAGVGNLAGSNAGLVLPSGQTLGALTDATNKNVSVNDKLLQAYLQGNPALAAQIDAAKTPGAPDATVLDTLGSINSTIDTLKQQDAVGNKNTIDALKSQQSQLAQQQGFTQGPSQLSQAQSLAGGISGAISGVFQSISSGLDALSATQDFADRLVYGVRNTEDINKLIDDYQKWITYAADVISTVGSIVSTIGSFTGGSDFGGTSAAGSALSLIAGVLQGVNAAIDFGQQVYEVTMGYVGKFMSVLTGLGGSDLMGNVGFLLNKNTGQLISYSQDNPQQQNTSKVPSWMNSWYDYNGGGNPNPQVNQQLNIYAGPGQSPGEMMNETMWMVNTGGTTGAMAPANF